MKHRGKFTPTQLPDGIEKTYTVIPSIHNVINPGLKFDNKIKTTKYTLLTFLPKNLFEQFHRFANIYFFFIIILNWIPQVNAFGKEIAMFPLLFVLAVTAIKDMFEDRQRYNSDKIVNNRNCKVFESEESHFITKKWKHVVVGDIIELDSNAIVPADILLLYTSDENGVCHVSTANLDGETNLKQKEIPKGFLEEGSEFSCNHLNFQVKCEQPNNLIHRFYGYICENDGKETAIDRNNLLLRGCCLKNTDKVVGIVIYAGHETKVMLNNSGPRYKRSRLEKDINKDVIACVFILLIFCTAGAIGCGLWTTEFRDFEEIFSTNESESSALYEAFLRFWTFVIVLQVIIPISLYVSVEIVKLGQVYFINQDSTMFFEKTSQYSVCRATNINEDLGQIEYVFSDKTGTLTENKMIFKKFSVDGVIHCHAKDTNSAESLCEHCDDNVWEEFFSALAVCNTVVVSAKPTDVENYRSKKHSTVSCNGTRDTLSSELLGFNSSENNQPFIIKPSRINSERLSRSVEHIHSWLGLGFEPVYEFESPDEGALVKAASFYGYKLANRTPDQVFFTTPLGEVNVLQILHVLRFDSQRKRMSVIVRDDEGRVKMYSKGADTAIMHYLKDDQDELQLATDENLEQFARDGLRTLCVAKRDLSESEYTSWSVKHKEAELALSQREEKLALSADAIEKDFQLLGVTGIEDRLQDGVPETIEKLRSAGIKVWILTGDKQETAVNIGLSSRLIDADMEIITLNSTSREDCNELLDHIQQRVNSKWPSYTVLPRHMQDGSEGLRPPLALIIDGVTLSYALEKPLDKKFIAIVRHCESVICCRAAPIQKAAVVSLVRENLKVMTLAIGDGANDVSMLQMAEIGVGIAGEEGVQAVMASDFVLGRFRFLQRLLLLHGFWCYDRTARMIVYFFYKNAMFVALLFWYQLYNGFSGSNAIDDISLILFNLLFTSLPPIVTGIFDQNISPAAIEKSPRLYAWGQRGKGYSRKLFWISILDAVYQSLVLFYIPMHAVVDLPVGMLVMGVTFHQLAVSTATVHIAIETPHWTLIHLAVFFGSVILSYIYYFIFCSISATTNVYGIIFEVMRTPHYWLLSFACTLIAVMPRYLYRILSTAMKPSIIQTARKNFRFQREHFSEENLNRLDSNVTIETNVRMSTPT